MAKCEICGTDMTRFGTRHRCLSGKIEGARKPSRLEAEQIAKGQLDPASLLPKNQPKASAEPVGRLARRPTDPQPARQPQPALADVIARIDRLTAAFEKLQAAITSQDKRTDA